MNEPPTQAYENRVVLVVAGLATATALAVGVSQPFWPLILDAAIAFAALVMLIRARKTTRLRQSWWVTLAIVSMPISLVVFTLVDATRVGMTSNHWLSVIVMSVFIGVFVVPQARLRGKDHQDQS